MKICGIYKITSPTGRIYIGSSKDVLGRKRFYETLACKEQIKIYRSIKKHNWQTHTFEILEECLLEELLIRERFWGEFYCVLDRNGLNCRLPKIEEYQKCFSEETRKKMSEVSKNRKYTDETRKKMSESAKNISEETRLKMGIAQKGKFVSMETRKKLSDAAKGRKWTDLQKEKIKISRKGKQIPEKCIQKAMEVNSKKVLNKDTNEIYTSATEASKIFNIDVSYLCKMLKNKLKNKTNLIYLNDAK